MAGTTVFDIVIVGGGPAGLTAAITGASEGLKVRVMDSDQGQMGGQASKSSLIENYPGFPDGISGEELTRNFVAQAKKFAAELICPEKAAGIRVDGKYRIIQDDDGDEFVAKAVILAGGLSYKKLPAENIGSLMGRGVLYGTPTFEPARLGTCQIMIVGGANSAGQAAMHLSKNADARITMLVRRPISEQMSRYLVDRITAAPNITVLEGVEVTKAIGERKLEQVELRNLADKTTTIEAADHLFIFIGAQPKTLWLNGSIVTNERKFILTDRHLSPESWTQDRPPLPLETCMPGVFCAGDVRFDSIKRITAASGEGAIAIQSCHGYLAQAFSDTIQ